MKVLLASVESDARVEEEHYRYNSVQFITICDDNDVAKEIADYLQRWSNSDNTRFFEANIVPLEVNVQVTEVKDKS